jgi:hypothetical protein
MVPGGCSKDKKTAANPECCQPFFMILGLNKAENLFQLFSETGLRLLKKLFRSVMALGALLRSGAGKPAPAVSADKKSFQDVIRPEQQP